MPMCIKPSCDVEVVFRQPYARETTTCRCFELDARTRMEYGCEGFCHQKGVLPARSSLDSAQSSSNTLSNNSVPPAG